MNNKYSKFVFLGLILVMLSGCGKDNVLNCKKSENNISHDVEIKFEGNTAKNVNYEEIHSYKKDDAYIDMKLLEIKEQYEVFDDENGIKYSLKENKDKIVLKASVDFSLYKNNIAMIPALADTYEANKIYLENNGYKCK